MQYNVLFLNALCQKKGYPSICHIQFFLTDNDFTIVNNSTELSLTLKKIYNYSLIFELNRKKYCKSGET